MASRQFTVDSAKKREFINIFLLMPESSVLNAMRQATFTEEDIANLPLRRFLQRDLPNGSIKGLKADNDDKDDDKGDDNDRSLLR